MTFSNTCKKTAHFSLNYWPPEPVSLTCLFILHTLSKSSKFEHFEKKDFLFIIIFLLLHNVHILTKNEDDNTIAIYVPFRFSLFLASENFFPFHINKRSYAKTMF